jgi:hypothetical protein
MDELISLAKRLTADLHSDESLIVWRNCRGEEKASWKLYVRRHDLGGTNYYRIKYVTAEEAQELVRLRLADDLYRQLKEEKNAV